MGTPGTASGVVGAGSDLGEDRVEGGEHVERRHEQLSITREEDATGHEGLLGVQLTGRDGHRGLPVLLHSDVLAIGRPGAEGGRTIGDPEVVGDIAFGGVGDDLGNGDAVLVSQFGESLVGGDGRRKLSDPCEGEVADPVRDGVGAHRPSLPAMPVTATDEGPHDGCVDEWFFAVWEPDGETGVVCAHRLLGRRVWYWSAVILPGSPLIYVADFEVRARQDWALVKGEQLWAEHVCEVPLAQWTIGNETMGAALDDAEEALGRGHGVPTPVAVDLEWYATADPEELVDGYSQSGVVHGVIELGGRPTTALAEAPAARWHRWSSGGPGLLDLPEVVAHTGRRAPFDLPGVGLLDLVLTPQGWRSRRGGGDVG